MRQPRDQAFVLRTRALGEADLIVTLLTEQHGKVQVVARSARRSRRRFGGKLEPMTRVRAVWSEKEGRELHRLESLDAERSFAAMQYDPVAQAACAALAEITELFSHAGQAEPKSFRLLGALLEALEGGAAPWVAMRYFEYWTLRLHGLLPDLDGCAECGGPLGRSSAARLLPGRGLLCAACRGTTESTGFKLAPADRDLLETLRRKPPGGLVEESRAARPGGAVEALLRGTLEAYAERRLRSYRHLRAALECDPGKGER